jgi:hypothetical protein
MKKRHRVFSCLFLSVIVLITVGYVAAQQNHPWSEVSLPVGKWPGLYANNTDWLQGYAPADFFALDFWDSSGLDIYYNVVGGNVGINTTTPGKELDVIGAIRASEICIGAACETAWPTDTDTRCDSPGECTRVCIDTACETSWPSGLGGSGTTNYIAKWSSVSSVTDSVIYESAGGNIGVGTTTPSETLEVSGNIRISDNANAGLILGSADVVNEGGQINWIGAGAWPIWYQDVQQNRMRFWPQGAPGNNLVLQVGGNVGIGTDTPSEKLDVLGTIRIANSSGDEGGVIRKETNWLAVHGTGVNHGAIYLGNQFTGWSVLLKTATTDSASNINFQDNSGTIMSLFRGDGMVGLALSGGNVGIGTSSPTHKLHVAGNVRITGTIQIQGGGPSSGEVLTATDSSGNANWQDPDDNSCRFCRSCGGNWPSNRGELRGLGGIQSMLGSSCSGSWNDLGSPTPFYCCNF